MSEQAINDALDALELDDDDVSLVPIKQEGEPALSGDPLEVVEPIVNEEEEVAAKPPGFLSYDEWIAKGKDPADYRGENAYNKHYDSLKEARELKDTMKQVVGSVDDLKQQYISDAESKIEQARVDLQAEFEQAKEDDDLDGALAAQDKLNNLDKPNAARTAPQVNPVISEFASKNPIVDSTSSQFNQEFFDDMALINNSAMDKLTGGDRTVQLNDAQIQRVQTMAYNETKKLHPDKFVSPRNGRAAPAKPTQRAVKSNGDLSTRVKQIKSDNANDSSAANDIYEMLKERDPAAAERYAKNILGET